MTRAAELVSNAIFAAGFFGMGIPTYIVLGIVALVALFILVFVTACLGERQYLTGDVEPVSAPYPYPPSCYWEITRENAAKIGLEHAGDFATKQNTTMVKGLQSMFISRDRQVIVAIVSGSTAGAKLKKTVLRTKMVNGRILESTDNPGMKDLSGVVDHAMLYNAGIAELVDFHTQRIQRTGMTPVAFKPNSVLQEYERMDLDRGARWVLQGLARWVDPQQTSIRMTVRGTFAHLKNLFQSFGKLGEQQHRAHIRRAG